MAEPIVGTGAPRLAAGPKPAGGAGCRRRQAERSWGRTWGWPGLQAGLRWGQQALTVLAEAAHEAGAAQAGSSLWCTGGIMLTWWADLLAAKPPAALGTI